jgi:DNA replication protein DnaC
MQPTRCVELVRAYQLRVVDGCALVLLGPTSVGKTCAVVALVNALLADLQTRQVYQLGSTLVRALADFRGRDLVVERCVRARLLVVDDLAPYRDEARVTRLLEEIFVVREAERRATVITSNVTPPLAGLLGDRVVDRLRSWGSVAAVNGDSLRRDQHRHLRLDALPCRAPAMIGTPAAVAAAITLPRYRAASALQSFCTALRCR